MAWAVLEDPDTTAELLLQVESMRGYAVNQLSARPDEVDAVLQEVRETVWRKADSYDPQLGNPSRFVFGVTRNIVHRHQQPMTATEELPDELPAPTEQDVLAGLVRRFDLHRWISLVADFVGYQEWDVITDLAFEGGSCEVIAARHKISPRQLRTVRDHVAHVTYTVRAALAALDLQLPHTGSVLINCLPPSGGYREAAEHLEEPGPVLAKRLGIHPGAARSRLAIARRLLTIAQIILDREP